jgi:UDP-N-acetylglucosamine 2-epimerase (non-hydrolysing)
LSEVISATRPDLVIVQGDTATTLMGAIAAHNAQSRLMHVEAGLRSGRKDAPFPEEMNRILVSHLADFHCAPTETASANLRNAGIVANVWVTGNTGIDALEMGLARLANMEADGIALMNGLDTNRPLILVTCHRRENFGKPFERIVCALKRVASEFPQTQILFPVHPNPNIRRVATKKLSGIDNIFLVDPLDYIELLSVLNACFMVVSDSGGLQEEAPALGKPVLVLRDVTERTEGIDAGTAKLVGTNEGAIFSAISELLTDEKKYKKMANAVNPYGDGKATARIIATLKSVMQVRTTCTTTPN